MLHRIAAMLIVGVPVAALAKDAAIGTVTINLPPPAGYCELDGAQASDARMLRSINDMLGASGNRLVAASADCKQLKEWRAGKRPLIDNMAQYQTLVSLESAPLPAPPELAIKELCNQMRAQADQLMADVADNLKERAEQAMEHIKFDEMQFLGVVAQEPLVCYAAILQKFKTETGADKAQVTVIGTTVIKGKIVYAYLYAPYVNPDSVTLLLAKHKGNIDKLQKANLDKPIKVKTAAPPPTKPVAPPKAKEPPKPGETTKAKETGN
jgi:hypothetical protein